MCYSLEQLLWWGLLVFFFFFKQKTAYEMRISDWSSDVCSSDLCVRAVSCRSLGKRRGGFSTRACPCRATTTPIRHKAHTRHSLARPSWRRAWFPGRYRAHRRRRWRSEEHTSELQSLMRSSYAVFCLKKKKQCNKKNR